MKNGSFLPYGKPSILSSEVESMNRVFSSSVITRGTHVEMFEKSVANYCGAEYAVAFNSGSSALSACVFAAKIKEGDRVISSPNTFVASVGTAVQRGAIPIFVDIVRDSGNLNVKTALSVMNEPSTRSRPYLVVVHFAGIAVDMKELSLKVKNPDAVIIEDGCHALGSTYPSGEKVGSCTYSDMTIFSFHPVKTITTGEGGMVTTNNPELYFRLKLFRDNGILRDSENQEMTPWMYDVKFLTGNYHFTEFQAALGLSQMQRLESFIEKRRELMLCYREHLNQVEHLKLFDESADARSAYHLCVAQIDFKALNKDRGQVMKELKEQGIGTQVHYIPLYRHPAFLKICNEIENYFPENERYYEEALTLPLFYDLEKSDVKRVCQTLTNVLTRN